MLRLYSIFLIEAEPNHTALAVVYIGLSARRKLRRLLRRTGPSRVRFLGLNISFIYDAALMHMLEDIFLEAVYGFEAERVDPLIIDCGSNIGISVLYFKRRYPRSKVMAFEPEKESFICLQRNVRENLLTGVSVFNKALLDDERTVELKSTPGSIVASVVSSRGGCISLVDGVRLSSFLQSEVVDFLKLDVEGAELQVLRDLARTGKLGNVRQMVIEYHHHLDPQEDRLADLFQILERHDFGYQVKSFAGPWRGASWRQRAFQDILVYAYASGPTVSGAPASAPPGGGRD